MYWSCRELVHYLSVIGEGDRCEEFWARAEEARKRHHLGDPPRTLEEMRSPMAPLSLGTLLDYVGTPGSSATSGTRR